MGEVKDSDVFLYRMALEPRRKDTTFVRWLYFTPIFYALDVYLFYLSVE